MLLSGVGLLLLLAPWSTLVAGIAALAGLAWFPLFLVYLWAIVVGIALVAIEWRQSAQAVSTQPA